MHTFDPLVQEWFESRFDAATEPQLRGWPEIAAGRDVLICAPTGSGKTLTAFLICLDRLVRMARAGTLPDRTEAVYVSPLKALSNDVRRNLERPLAEIASLAEARGIKLQPIRVSVRTGDTPASERQQMLKHPPHILVTTPESLFILLTAAKSREMLRTARTMIVDEIHAVAGDKRGSHLALTIARLDHNADERVQKIGLSATVRPAEDVAAFLAPGAKVIDIGHRREMDLAVEVPNDILGAVASNEMWAEIYDRLARHILENRTTLIFVNTRRLSERVAHALSERLGEGLVLPHHGSLARELRLDAESRLKAGELRAVVATASLELGIDIGAVDLTIQIGTPRSIAVALQRIGRSGHWVGARPRGIFFPTTRDELVETAALVHGIRSGLLEHIRIPENALDIVAQQVVAEVATAAWNEDDLFALVRSTYPFRRLDRGEFDDVITMLSEGIATSRGRSGAMLHRDTIGHVVRGRRGARLAAVTSGGAIPENANYTVIAEPDGRKVGTVDEDFAVESVTGDVFLLGTQSWRIRHVGGGQMRVEDAQGAPSSLPFWLGEAPGRSEELSSAVSEVRENAGLEWLQSHCGVDEAGARQIVDYIRDGVAGLGALPTSQTVVLERFFDESGGMQLVIHAPFGARINRAWGLALRKRFCRTFNFELQAAATDNGIVISLSDQHAFPLELVYEFLKPGTVEDVLTQALLPSPMFGARWRWNATRALAVLRYAGGRKVPPPLQRMKSDDLLASVFPDQVACAENLSGPIRVPDHPLVRETIRNCLHEAMDLDGLKRVLTGIEAKQIHALAIDTPEPSFFGHEILNANPYAFLDNAPLEERRARAVQLRRTLGSTVVQGDAILDPAAIAAIEAEVWPDVRNADELHDALLTVIRMPSRDEWEDWFLELRAAGRALMYRGFWVAIERRQLADDAVAALRGWMESTGPSTAAALSARLGFDRQDVDIALARLEGEGQILRGSFTPSATETEWCNRRVLARIHRLTIGKLRREIEPVSASQLHAFLARWHHLTPGTQLHGADGLLQIIRQLQGYEIPAAAWESQILPARVAAYTPDLLDDLCLSGEVMWGRLSQASDPDGRVRATRIAPLTLFLREDAGWLIHPEARPADSKILDVLRRDRACFFGDLVRAAHMLPSEVEDALWELAASGLVTSDGFENIRALIDPKRRRGEGSARHNRPRHAAGRWALMPDPEPVDDRVERWAMQLLARWGVIMRDLMARESAAPPWRDLIPVLRRLEARGLIRGGRFVGGLTGEQFALPEALDLLRATRRADETFDASTVSHTDPLNLTGIILPGPRISPLSSAIPVASARRPLRRPAWLSPRSGSSAT